MKIKFHFFFTKNIFISTAFLLASAVPMSANAANKKILVYYCDCDAWGTDCGNNFVAALQADATNTVTAIDASDGCTPGGPYTGAYYCPGANATSAGPNGEIWNNYDQVWDVRYINQNSVCPPSGTNEFPDYFGSCWQTTAQDYLTNYCGSLFMLAENSGFESRWYGEMQLLMTLGGVSASFTLCPGANGNGFGSEDANLPVINLPGATQVGFADEGGIPNGLLNGTSFVNVAGTQYADGVARSAAAGWNGSAGAFTSESGCNLGKASIFFDMDDWAGGYPAGGLQPTYAQALANWFGVRNCSCNTPTPTPTPTITASPTNTPSPTATFTPMFSFTPTNTITPTFTPTITFTMTPTPTATPVANVTILESVSPSTAQPGDTLTYTITVVVTGASATNVVVMDTLPNTETFVSFGTVSNGVPSFNAGSSQLTWTLSTPLAPGSYQLIYQATVNNNVASGTITNTANLTYLGLASPLTSSASVSISSSLHVWPNPFNPNLAVGGVFKASVVPAGAEMDIYSISGEMVWSKTSKDGGEIDWAGINNNQVQVSTGTYYYVIHLGTKNLLVGKVLVLMSKTN